MEKIRQTYWDDSARKNSGRHVTVIGAGIIGLTSAAALVRAGRTVDVIDAGPSVASGASRANGCQLSYGYVAPLAQPGLLAELPKLLFASGAPLQIRPSLDAAQWRWMLSFLAACRTSVALRSTAALLALGQISREETESWIAGTDVESIAFRRSGKLVLLPTSASLESARRQMVAQAGIGPEQRLVSENEALLIEPALVNFRGRIAGAIYTKSECAIDSFALCCDLERQLRDHGVTFNYGVKVTGLVRGRISVTHLSTSGGLRKVEDVVMANGHGSAALGLNVPVQPLKGYSITVPITNPSAAPGVSITDAANKVVYARIGNRLRVAGMAELRGDDNRIDARRVEQLLAHAKRAFKDVGDFDNCQPWAGMRPVTPTSIPVIARSPNMNNLFVNVGHGALGLTLAFGSARRLVNLMS